MGLMLRCRHRHSNLARLSFETCIVSTTDTVITSQKKRKRERGKKRGKWRDRKWGEGGRIGKGREKGETESLKL